VGTNPPEWPPQDSHLGRSLGLRSGAHRASTWQLRAYTSGPFGRLFQRPLGRLIAVHCPARLASNGRPHYEPAFRLEQLPSETLSGTPHKLAAGLDYCHTTSGGPMGRLHLVAEPPGGLRVANEWPLRLGVGSNCTAFGLNCGPAG